MKNKNLNLLIKTFDLGEGTTIQYNKKGFVAAVCAMDIQMISRILQDDKMYQGVSKSTFVGKLKDSFDTFKKNKDTHLIAYEGTCNGGNECPNHSKKGMLFAGNHSKKTLSFVIDEDYKGVIIDFDHCIRFSANEIGKDFSKDLIGFKVYADDSPRFYPDDEYRYFSPKFKQAIQEIKVFENRPILKTTLINWYKKYRPLMDEAGISQYFFKDYANFSDIYYCVRDIYDWLLLEQKAAKKLNEYLALEQTNKSILPNWLTENEEFYQNDLESFLAFLSEKQVVNNCIEIILETNTLFNLKYFKNTLNLKAIFEKKSSL